MKNEKSRFLLADFVQNSQFYLKKDDFGRFLRTKSANDCLRVSKKLTLISRN